MILRLLYLVVVLSSAAGADDSVDYTREVKPLLKQRCYACHGVLQQKSGLRLDTVAAMRKGGDGGDIIDTNAADLSLLIERITATDDIRMPPKGEATPFSSEEVELVRRWISQGAKGPAEEPPEINPRDYWSYKPVRRDAVPGSRNPGWIRTPIDAFIAAEHDKRSMIASLETTREGWLRRVTLDLVGLPPTRGERHEFLADSRPDAYERVVDRLLARPEYGERWGRHWMDVWRYSDWYGSRAINEIRYSQRHIWRWRDWIIESLNEDKPYDRLVVEMLAGDEIAPSDDGVLRATGFLGRNWYKFDRNVWMFDAVEHTAQAFLGLTLRCARCHDHKFDPISHEDYYRFRAFFEPHDVRTDRLATDTLTEKDATLGMVLKDGVSRAFDKTLDVPTYVFTRGDSRYPDEKRRVTPGVPASLGNDRLEIVSLTLPPDAYYPALKPRMTEGLLAQAVAEVQKAQDEIETSRKLAVVGQQKVDDVATRLAKDNAPGNVNRPLAFHDNFATARPEAWRIISGNWVNENGALVQKSVSNFATLVSTVAHPRDFQARWKYRPLATGGLRSIGISFDYVDQGNSQDIYTHVNDSSQGIQAFHRLNGQQVYPQSAIVKTDTLKVGEVATVEISVRGTKLTIRLNGQQKLDYVLPVPRRDGKFALWAHNGTVEFQELEIRELIPSLDDLRRDLQVAKDNIGLAEKRLIIAHENVAAVKARIVAEKACYGADPAAGTLALAASRAERVVAAAKAAEPVLRAEQHLARVQAATAKSPAVNTSAPVANSAALEEAKKKLADAQQALSTAQAAIEKPDAKYTPLGEQFPTSSTGRRLALARWITDPRNPRTARVAANYLWMHHFGRPLVPTVDNFGLNGQSPTHPQLLDWLAAELVAQNWRMKPIHKLIVLSRTYRMSSAEEASTANNHSHDPDNKFLWKMNSRRMEAEVVRDSVLSTAGLLDCRRGGPEIPESEGQTTYRRSLYFRITPNEKMKFLETFDVADPNACYRRRESVVPQQALALMNSAVVLDQARSLAQKLTVETGDRDDDATNKAFVAAAYEQILNRVPAADETAACLRFLKDDARIVQEATRTPFPAGGQSKQAPSAQPHLRARENLVHVLYSHNDFVTIR